MRRDENLPQVCFSILGQEALREYRTKDLFQPHPSVPDARCWQARADDIIVFLNGEKTNPVSMEHHVVAQNPGVVSGALVIGTQRFQAALVIESTVVGSEPFDTTQQAELIESIWPSIQEANKAAPAHVRVEKALILILPGPLLRGGEGTIQRAASIAQYRSDIDTLYANADTVNGEDEDEQGATVSFIDMADTESVNRFINESAGTITGWVSTETQERETANFFDRGMDSLTALQLLRILRRRFHRPDLGLSTIYSNPTISQLQAAITSGTSASKDDDLQLMQPLLKTYGETIQQIQKPRSPRAEFKSPDKMVTAVLTGSTGTVGTFLLHALLARSQIKHVVCLNRGQDGGRAAQTARLAAAGIESGDQDQQRVTFLQADLSQPLLGLDGVKYCELRDQAGLIIHNAWPVNFNLGLAAFQEQFAGLVNLFRLAAETTPERTPRVIFISSVSAVGGLAGLDEPVPEEVFTSLDTPYANGYARSKFLSELMCDAGPRRLGLDTVVFRVGQVGGAVQRPEGEWDRTKWLPSPVIGSKEMASIPDNLGPQFSEIDWIPSDELADVLADLALSQSENPRAELEPHGTTDHEAGGARVFNIRNPCTTTWESLLPTIIEAIKTPTGSELESVVVTPSEWLARLTETERKTVGDGPKLSNPAIRLLELYHDSLWGASNGTQRSQLMAINGSMAKSRTLRGMQAVNPGWMHKWVGKWMA